MIDLPLDRLLEIAETDRQENEAAFQATAKKIDPIEARRRGARVAASRIIPRLGSCCRRRRTRSTRLRQFIVDHHIVTIPPSEPAQVKETPPFMRSTTSASMDTPGPFEKARARGASTT